MTDTTRQDYSFENPDVVAYVDGDPVSKASMDNYILMKKAYMEALETNVEEHSDTDESTFSETIYNEWNMKRISEINSYSEKDWVKDYYKSILINKKYHDVFENADEQLKADGDEEVENVLNRAKNTDSYIEMFPVSGSDSYMNIYPDSGIIVEVDDDEFDVVLIIQYVAAELGISFEECVDNVYRPFFITEEEYGILLNIEYDGLDYGEKIEYDGANDVNYGNYVLNAMEINRGYLNSLFEQAEIVERP
jgi:hypothetical protein